MSLVKIVRYLSVIAMLFLFMEPLAAYMVRSLPMTLDQPDGSILECFASGDEYHNWLHDKDNLTIIRDTQTGYYCYARRSGTGIVSSGLIAGKELPQNRDITPGINISEAEYKQLRATKFQSPPERDAPTTGTINNLVIYIRFSDETEFGQLNSIYDGWFNTGTSSQKNYFLEASYNQLTVNTSFYPAPSGGYVVSWQDSHARAYFQPYDATSNPTGYNGDTERRTREFTLLQNACAGVSSQIPSSLTIDADGDGRVDNVVFLIKGSAGAWSSLLWPHRWSLYDRYVYINGKRVYDFNLQLQTFLASRGVGVICHEFFHTLGAPDLYHYTDNGISTAGSWDLMESDQNPPQHMTAFMKYKYGDWITSIPTITTDQVYTLNPLTSSTGQAYRINSNNASQYYIVEFRKDTGTFESSIPGSGMLIYRINTSCGDGNADGPPDELYIYRPNGTTTVNGTISSANYSSETGRIKIDSTTNPTPFLQDGTAGNLYLCEIGSSAGTTMSFRKGLPYVDFSPNPYTQSFDATSFPPDAWINQTVSGTYSFERVTSGTNPTCSPKSGAGMLRYNSDIAAAGSSALLATPRIVCSDVTSSGYKVSFWMYRDGNQSTALDKIEVYLNATQNLSGTPTLLGTVNRARQQAPVVSTPGWYQYTFDLPVSAAGEYYVLLKAISAAGYNIFIDHIALSKVPKPAINPVPADLATGVNFTQSLSWQSGGGSPSTYKLYLGTDNPPTNLVNGTALGNVLSYTPTNGLLLGTQYYWRIVPSNTVGDATTCPVWSFTTLADTSIFPMSEAFGTTGTVFPPTNWLRYTGVLASPTVLTPTTSYWGQDDWLNLTTTPQNLSARVNIYSTRNAWLVTPLLNIPAGAKLEFDLGLTDYSNSNPISSDPLGTTGIDDQFAVLIGDGTSWTQANLLRLWDNAGSANVYNDIPSTGQRIVINLNGFTGYKYIAFYGASSASNADNDLFVDNVAISLAPATPQLILSNNSWNAGTVLLNASATTRFTITNGGTASLQINSLSVSGDTAFSLVSPPSLPLNLALGQSVTLTARFLPTSTGDHSAFLTFTDNRSTVQIQLSGTGYDARIFSLPSSQGFDEVTIPALPLGWNAVVASTSTGSYIRTSTTYPVSLPNSLCFYNSTDASADLRLVSPEIIAPLSNARLRFSARGSSAGYQLLIGTMNNPTGTFTLLASVDLTATTTQYTISLAGYSGSDRYLAFKHGLGGTSRSIYLDDLLLENLLTSDMMLTSLSGSGIGVAGNELSFTVRVRNNGTQLQNSYTVRLISSEIRTQLASLDVFTPLAPDSTATHILSWTPDAEADLRVYAEVIAGTDGFAENNSSDSIPTFIYPTSTAIPIAGDQQSNTTANTLPLDFYFKNSVSETIYLASELMLTAGDLTALVYYNNFVQDLSSKPVKIWAKNTTETDLSASWSSFDGYTLVFDGTVDFPMGTNSIIILFQTPLRYTGGNLAIRVSRPMDSVYYNMNNHFFYSTDSLFPNRSRYLYNDNTTYDPTAPSAAGTLSSDIPLTAFIMADHVPLVLSTPVPVLNTTAGQMTLSWQSVQGAETYLIFATDDPTTWADAPLATSSVNSYSLSPTQAKQFFRIVAAYQPSRFNPGSYLPYAPQRKNLTAEELLPRNGNKD